MSTEIFLTKIPLPLVESCISSLENAEQFAKNLELACFSGQIEV
jgi:hypothetical protein